MHTRKKINVEVSAGFADILSEAASRGMPAVEVTEMFAEAWTMAKGNDDAAAGTLLRRVLSENGSVFKGEDFIACAKEPAVGVHVGDPRTVTNCPFGRDYVGIDAGELRPDVLVERTFAEWRVGPKTVRSRHIVIIYKASQPMAIYRDVTWGRSPDQLPDGQPGRQNKGRHYVASAEVTFFGPGKTYAFEAHADERGFIRPHLSNERPLDQTDPVLSYVLSHRRERRAVQQPLDLLDAE